MVWDQESMIDKLLPEHFSYKSDVFCGNCGNHTVKNHRTILANRLPVQYNGKTFKQNLIDSIEIRLNSHNRKCGNCRNPGGKIEFIFNDMLIVSCFTDSFQPNDLLKIPLQEVPIQFEFEEKIFDLSFFVNHCTNHFNTYVYNHGSYVNIDDVPLKEFSILKKDMKQHIVYPKNMVFTLSS